MVIELNVKKSLIFSLLNFWTKNFAEIHSERYLDVAFDPAFSFKKYFSNICRSAFYHIRDLRSITIHLNKATAISLSNALVRSRLDYCNSLLFDCSEKKYKTNLQRVQNCLARVVTRSSMLSESGPLLKSQHWLPIKSLIKFKLNLLTYIFGYSLKSQWFTAFWE